MIDAGTFRNDYPEFTTALVGDSVINYWIGIANMLLNQNVWGAPDMSGATGYGEGGYGQGGYGGTGQSPSKTQNLYDYGVELFTAHHVVLEIAAIQDVAVGGIPGITKGGLAACAGGDVSVSYMGAAVIELGAGHWNNTVYGLRFIRLAKMVGGGGVYVAGCISNIGPLGWSGPGFGGGPGWPFS